MAVHLKQTYNDWENNNREMLCWGLRNIHEFLEKASAKWEDKIEYRKENFNWINADHIINSQINRFKNIFSEIDKVLINKTSPDQYTIFFICNNMPVSREEQLIELEIELEDLLPFINLDFLVIRKNGKSIDCFHINLDNCIEL